GVIATEQLEPLAAPGAWRQIPGLLLGHGVASLRWRDLPTVLPWSLEFLRRGRRHWFTGNNAALHALQSHTAEDWRTLAAAVPAVGALTQFRGHDELFESQRARTRAQPALLAQRADGVNWRDLEEIELSELRQTLPHVVAGVRYLDTGQVASPIGVVRALAQDLSRRGGRFLRSRIESIRARESGFDLHTAAALIQAPRVVVAAGARSARLLAPLGLRTPLIAERGYHFSFPRRLPLLARPVLLRERSVVITPMEFGFRTTSFVEFAAPARPPTRAKWQRLGQHLREAGLWRDTDVPDAWMGERPTLPDYLPAIGTSRRHRGLFYALGHQHLGLTLSAPTARALADLITADKRASFLDALSLHRFG
ncbi:MAG: FAD-binding oxidoreductase, partial [Proteobacteria bacterium]|nr:FAD-binding oxidoreductase [Pseudomonadota bacterium]